MDRDRQNPSYLAVYFARNENARATRVMRNFLFTSGTDVDMYFQHSQLLFPLIQHSRNTNLFSESRAIFPTRDIRRTSWFTRICKCKVWQQVLIEERKITQEWFLLFRDLCPHTLHIYLFDFSCDSCQIEDIKAKIEIVAKSLNRFYR